MSESVEGNGECRTADSSKLSTLGSRIVATLCLALALFLASLICRSGGTMLLFAPLAGTAAVVFGAPDSAIARLRAPLGGHLMCGAVGLFCLSIAPAGGLCTTVVFASAIAFLLMLCSDTMHSPAGATPAALASAASVSVSSLAHLLLALLTILLIAHLARYLKAPDLRTTKTPRHSPSTPEVHQ